ncbi:uncharacterized protein LOC105683486 [Athalia rosae]|uniref:uncharacterized protein LOC105683486 n=1 Tax=Athalia rosae TaxID=37344 RepID=UPI0006266E1A|nr:uncharacterized protein LOC105683486 [Athalia rosae]
MACNPFAFIFWGLVLILVSFWVAGFCAMWYIWIYCCSAWISACGEFADILLQGVQFPYYCASKMC